MQCEIGNYERNILQRANGLEAVEITWKPGSRTKKHTHRNSKGYIWVLRGRIFEVREGRKSYYSAGVMLPEVDNGVAHIVGNDSGKDAVTFHVFTPELEMDYLDDDRFDIAALAEKVGTFA